MVAAAPPLFKAGQLVEKGQGRPVALICVVWKPNPILPGWLAGKAVLWP